MAESLFTTQTPGGETHEVGPTLGTVIVVAVAGQVTQGRWYTPATLPSGSVAYVLYDATTQAELGRATFGTLTAGAWNTVTLSTPVNVTASQRLIAAIHTPDWYAYTGGFFTSAGVTNGNLSAPATGSDPIGNGRFATGADAYPDSTFGGNCYFTDVVFTASGAGVAPNGLAVPVTLGSPSVAWSGTSAPTGISVPVALGSPALAAAGLVPDGISVPVALGSPTLAWSGSIAPDGVAAPVALGAPIVGAASVNPDGVAVPVIIGSPALTWSASISPGGVPVPVTLGVPTVVDSSAPQPVGTGPRYVTTSRPGRVTTSTTARITTSGSGGYTTTSTDGGRP